MGRDDRRLPWKLGGDACGVRHGSAVRIDDVGAVSVKIGEEVRRLAGNLGVSFSVAGARERDDLSRIRVGSTGPREIRQIYVSNPSMKV